jgi:hypothetical protein
MVAKTKTKICFGRSGKSITKLSLDRFIPSTISRLCSLPECHLSRFWAAEWHESGIIWLDTNYLDIVCLGSKFLCIKFQDDASTRAGLTV